MPGRRARTFAHIQYSLWLGSDHLLQVTNSYFTEDYQRFYYRDIQAIIVCKTDRATVLNTIYLVIAVPSALVAIFSDTLGIVIGSIVSGLFFLAFLMNFVRGATCRCVLRTAVQNEQLISLDRLRLARKTIHRLRPLIESAQAQHAQTDPLPGASAESALPVQPLSAPLPTATVPVEKPKPHETGTVHAATFVLLSIVGLLSSASLMYNHVVLTLLLIAALLAAGACTFVALVRQHGSDIGKELARTLWVTLGYFCTIAVLGYIYWLLFYFESIQSVDRPELVYNYWAWLQRFAAQSPTNSPFLIAIYSFSIVGSVSLSGFGLFWLFRHWKQSPNVPPPVPAGS